MKKIIFLILTGIIAAGTIAAGGKSEAAASVLPAEVKAGILKPGPDGIVKLPGGTFVLGPDSMPGVPGYNEIAPRVTLSPFKITTYLITQREYQEVMGKNPSYVKGDMNTLPVDNVTWFDAIEFCNQLSRNKGLTPVYSINGTEVSWNRSANGYRLPTEAEWEYTATAGKMPFPEDNHPWGMRDMPSNMWEWCWDLYAVYSADAQTDPAGSNTGRFGDNRVMRAGSFAMCTSRGEAVRLRSHSKPNSTSDTIGFRVVLSGI